MHSTHTKSLTLALTLLIATAFAPVALSSGAVAQSQSQQTVTVSGDVAIENQSAAGDRITITPLTQQFQQAGRQVQTTVSGGSYSANVTAAPLYFVRLQHDGAAHYRLVSDPSAVDFRLDAALSARVVTDEGEPVANRTMFVLSSLGPPVVQVTTDENGSFTAGPVQSNATYRVSARVKGAPYRWSVATNRSEPARLVVRDPTRNESVLTATGGNPASHVIQPQQNQMGDGTVVVETLTLENTGDRPFAGGVTVNLPANASGVEARLGNQTMPTRRVDGGVQVNASLAAGTTRQLAVRYTISGERFEKTLAHDTEQVAVVLQGANVSQVETSANLAPGDSPIPLVTNDDPVSAGDEISVTLPDQSGSSMSTGDQSGESSGAVENAGAGSTGGTEAPDLPTAALLGALVVTVVAGIGAYRFL